MRDIHISVSLNPLSLDPLINGGIFAYARSKILEKVSSSVDSGTMFFPNKLSYFFLIPSL